MAHSIETHLKPQMTTNLIDLICQMQIEGYEKWKPRW